MKLKLCFLASLCLYFGASAQGNKNNISAGLKVGDVVPDVLLARMVNGRPGDVKTLAGFRGKLLIIDFWSTYCGTCVRALPGLDSLQQAFADKIVILPVTTEKTDRVVSFWKANSLLNILHLPSVVEDQVLGNLFPHRMVPHDVWISPDGHVLGFTEIWEVTGPRIHAALSGGPLGVEMKQDAMNYDRNKPLLVDNNGGNDGAYLYRSVLTGYLKGVSSGVQVQLDTQRHMIHIRATNITAKHLYALAVKQLRYLPDARIIGPGKNILVPDPGNIVDLDSVHAYSYELTLPASSAALIRRSVGEDLDRFFRISTEWVEHDTAGLVITSLDSGSNDHLPDPQTPLTLRNVRSDCNSTAELTERLTVTVNPVVEDDARRVFTRPLLLSGNKITVGILNQKLAPFGLRLTGRRVRVREFCVTPLSADAAANEPFTL